MHDNPKEAALSYIAGILDGEGTFRINKCVGEKTMKVLKRKNPIYCAHVSVGMVHKGPLDFILEHADTGSIRYERVRKENRRDIWRWATTGREKTARFIRMVLPYLIVKKEQALLCLEFCDGFSVTESRFKGLTPDELLRREDLFMRCKALNVVGAPATTKSFGTRDGEAIV